MPPDRQSRPRVCKGALMEFKDGVGGIIERVVVFQYNPEKIARKLSAITGYTNTGTQAVNQPSSERQASTTPVETINLTLELDATDQLENPSENPMVVGSGVLPTLSAIEMMMYPERHSIIERNRERVTSERTISTRQPTVLFIWGNSRIMPVRLTSLSIIEEAFDTNLNPIRAKVELEMKLLNDTEMDKNTLGYNAYLGYIANKRFLSQAFSARATLTKSRQVARG
jgi:hypothetical protein